MSVDQLWKVISQADKKNYALTAATQQKIFGLVPGHAYSLLGAYELKDPSGRVVQQLVHMRNPWASETTYNGPWNDSDRQWTDAFKQQVPYELSDDGEFFINIRDFVKGFPIMAVTFVNDNFVYSYI